MVHMRRSNWKSKTSRELLSLMEVPSLCGVLTRAKTLALKKATVDGGGGGGGGSYIQLRSRRLVKPNLIKKDTNPNKVDSVKKLGDKDDEIEGSIGENTLEIQGKGRTTRETTPCSLIRDSDIIKTPPGSSTKSRIPAETKYRVLKTTPKPVPSTSEMDEFFLGPEMQQQQLFIDKYNFDPVNEKPLHGRYEWVKLNATKKS